MNQALDGAVKLEGKALIKYQRESGLVPDGILGPMTRSALIADDLATHLTDLLGWRGSFGLLIRCEGFKGGPYVPPGANAGVTLDYGFDLGQHNRDDLHDLYGHLWTPDAMSDLSEAIGLRGAAAREWRKGWLGFRWEITRDEAAKILPRAAARYWLAALRACPALRDAPPQVQTALLSVVYSAWTEPVREVIKYIGLGDWDEVADHIRFAKGAKGRRELEAKLIESVAEEG